MGVPRFLKQLKEANWFPRLLTSLQELSQLLPALLLMDFDMPEVEKLVKEQVALQPMASMAQELAKHSTSRASSLRKVVCESFAKALKSKSMATEELMELLMDCKEDKELVLALKDVCCHRRRLESLPRPSAGPRERMSSMELSGLKELIASFDRAWVAISAQNGQFRCRKRPFSIILHGFASISDDFHGRLGSFKAC